MIDCKSKIYWKNVYDKQECHWDPLAPVDDKTSDDAQNDAQKLEGTIINLIIVQENVQENDEDIIIDYIRNILIAH